VCNIKMDLTQIGWGGVGWIDLAQERDQSRALVSTFMNLRVPQMSSCTIGSFSRRAQLHEVSCLRGDHFESRAIHRPSWLRFFVIFQFLQASARIVTQITSQLILPNPSQSLPFQTVQWSSYVWIPRSLSCRLYSEVTTIST
jgi:hypothetical protein